MHKPLFRIAAGSVAAVGGLLVASAMPAGAVTAGRAELASTCSGATVATPCSDGTTVTFSVTSIGTLAMTAPDGPSVLGSVQNGVVTGTTGATKIGTAGDFGAVTVTDTRGLDPADWTVSVYSTPFVNQSNIADTIPAADATYGIPASGPNAIVADTVSGLPLPPTADLTNDALAPITLASGPTGSPVVTEIGADGDNAATWNPEIDVNVPATAVVGTYQATVTHSVD